MLEIVIPFVLIQLKLQGFPVGTLAQQAKKAHCKTCQIMVTKRSMVTERGFISTFLVNFSVFQIVATEPS